MSNIPSPRVLPGEKVLVQNYRSSKKPWEPGRCIDATYTLRGSAINSEDDGHWGYEAILDRNSRGGGVVRLYVGDEHIQPVEARVR